MPVASRRSTGARTAVLTPARRPDRRGRRRRRAGGEHWLIVDEALAGLPARRRGADRRPPAGDPGALVLEGARDGRVPRRLRGAAGGRRLPLAPVLGVGAPALAGALWAVEQRRRVRAPAPRAGRRASARGWRRRSTRSPPGARPVRRGWRAAGRREALAARRIYVAPGTAWGDEQHVRVTLRDAAATDRLVRGAARAGSSTMSQRDSSQTPTRSTGLLDRRARRRPRSRRARAGALSGVTAAGGENSGASVPASSATTIRPAGEREPRRAAEPAASSAQTPTSVSTRRDSQRVGQQPARAVGAALEAARASAPRPGSGSSSGSSPRWRNSTR